MPAHPSHLYRQLVQALLGFALLALLGGCSSLSPNDPLKIDVAGIEPLPGQGMEMRFTLILRVQNPNDGAIDYNGIALDMDINGHPLASGVSDQQGDGALRWQPVRPFILFS